MAETYSMSFTVPIQRDYDAFTPIYSERESRRVRQIRKQIQMLQLEKELQDARNALNPKKDEFNSVGGSHAGGFFGRQADWFEDSKKALQLRQQEDDYNRQQSFRYREMEKEASHRRAREVSDRQAASAAALFRMGLSM